MMAYSSSAVSLQPVQERPPCPVCEKMQDVLDRLLAEEREVDARIVDLERACSRAGITVP